jgi:regulator of cell morphogenesis and NO signaling
MSAHLNNTLPGNPLTVAQLAVSHPGALSVFTKYNIDYCCGGHRSIEEACIRVGLDPEKIKREIYESSSGDSQQVVRPEKWNSALLIDYIIQNHHAYVKESSPEIVMLLDKVCNAHGSDVPELFQIRDLFLDLSQELIDHMNKEELILFPALKRLNENIDQNHPLQRTIHGPIAAMEHEHDSAGELIKAIRGLSNNYTIPEFACPTFRITFKKLQEYDNDLMRHIHLENNILFPRTKQKSQQNSCSL